MRGMLVHGAIIPPRSVLDAVADVVRSVPEPAQVEAVAPQKGLLGRLGRRRDGAESVDGAGGAVTTAPMLERVPPDRMVLPITGFGNLTTNDARRLVETLREAAAGWSVPRLRLAGGAALDYPGDWSVWARLEGDLEAVAAIAQGVTQTVERLGYFVDRRQFRPMLSVATVTPATTGPFVQSVVDALEAFRGEEWTAEVSLTKETFVEGGSRMVEFERIPAAG
jgi:2'-5' RNA ligase